VYRVDKLLLPAEFALRGLRKEVTALVENINLSRDPKSRSEWVVKYLENDSPVRKKDVLARAAGKVETSLQKGD